MNDKNFILNKKIKMVGLAVFILAVVSVFSVQNLLAAELNPAQKKQLHSMKMHFTYEQGICKEQCQQDSACLNACQDRFDKRMATAVDRLTGEPPVSDIPDIPACSYCGMHRKKFAHSRMFIAYDDESDLGTCSIHCAAIDLAVYIDKTPLKIWVGDYQNKDLIDAEAAVWVLGGRKPGVMTKRAKWAFRTKAGAEAFIREHEGEIITFDEAMEAAYEDMNRDTRMIREKRKNKRMKKMANHG